MVYIVVSTFNTYGGWLGRSGWEPRTNIAPETYALWPRSDRGLSRRNTKGPPSTVLRVRKLEVCYNVT